MSLLIGPDTQVTLHFSLKLDNGDVVDSNFDAAPATFVMGDKSLLPGYEKRLSGLTAGDEASFQVPPEDGFGQPNPNNIQRFKRSDFDDSMELSEGLVITFSDAANGQTPGVVSSFDDVEVVIDFNHPLAGKTITFEVKVVAVNPAPQAV